MCPESISLCPLFAGVTYSSTRSQGEEVNTLFIAPRAKLWYQAGIQGEMKLCTILSFLLSFSFYFFLPSYSLHPLALQVRSKLKSPNETII